LPRDAPEGNCPACLLKIALGVHAPPPAAAAAVALEGRFSDFELLDRIGRGGMGTVYKARQISLNRDVALKIIRTGQEASEHEIKRFKMEAESAASLDHPNIVPVYEVGEHAGWHYLSMKLVEGQNLERGLTRFRDNPRAIATLLAKLARAVHYAHQNGILHRDLKPSNIILDAAGEPHITDFGLAKRVDQDTGMTLTGQVLGTPGYIGPEQLQTSARRLTTAADIYSLGAIFYKLLTGVVPFRADTPWETLRLALEQEPKRPSTIVDRVDRDLETICLRCLEREPARRYGSAEALAEELERWLRHEPIQARPSNVWARTGKWARRRPAAAAAIALLIVGTCVSTWQAVRATRAQRHAKLAGDRGTKMAEFLEQMLRGIKPSVAKGRDTTVLREMLERAEAELPREMREFPDVQAHLSSTMAAIYDDLGDRKKSVALNREAIRLFRLAPDPENEQVIRCLNNLGVALRAVGELEAGEQANREALELCRKVLGNEHRGTAAAMLNLATILYDRGNFREAEKTTLEALPIIRKVHGEESDEMAAALGNLAGIREKLDNLAGAERANRQSIAILERTHGRVHPGVVTRLKNLGYVLQRQGKLNEAETLIREALATSQKLFGEEHAEVAHAWQRLGGVLQAQGKLGEAESAYRKALAMGKTLLGNEHPTISHYCFSLAQLLQSRGEFTEAESLARESLEIRRKAYGQEHRWVAESLGLLAGIERKQGNQIEADNLQAKADAMQQHLKAK
jgi:tetratricopeptide (TPR) repeat protein